MSEELPSIFSPQLHPDQPPEGMTGAETMFWNAWCANIGKEGAYKAVQEALRIKTYLKLKERLLRFQRKYGALPALTKKAASIRSAVVRNRTLSRLSHHVELNDFSGLTAVFSDAHFHPDHDSDAFLVFLSVLKDLKPDLVINNGDAFDGASISRFPRIGWEARPTVAQEIKACKRALEMIREASPESRRFWLWGNHDQRFDNYLSRNAEAMEELPGTRLCDHFPDWPFSVSMSLNDHTVIKHRFHSGMHAAYNNTLRAGKSIITGHTHRGLVRPWADLNGTRYGVECGTLADVYGPQFGFMENNPRDWQSGFVIAHVTPDMIDPVFVEVRDGRASYNGREYRVEYKADSLHRV